MSEIIISYRKNNQNRITIGWLDSIFEKTIDIITVESNYLSDMIYKNIIRKRKIRLLIYSSLYII